MVPKKKFGNENVKGQNPNVKWWNPIALNKIDPHPSIVIRILPFDICQRH